MNTSLKQYTALIVDDEKLARANISYALQELEHWEVVGECKRGDEVLENVEKYQPDLVFLDIKMPGLSGLLVCQQLQQLTTPPIIVFVTAYDAHAVEAFELCALDYLLKPFDDERFIKTIKRVEEMLVHNQNQQEQVNQLEKISNKENTHLKTLVVRSVGRIQLVEVSQLLWLSTAGNYIELHLNDQVILHRASLSYLEKHLTDTDFYRVHRTAMVRISQIIEFITLADGQYQVVLKNGDKVSVSQSHKEELLNRLGIN